MQQQGEQLSGTVEAVTFENPANGFAVLTLALADGELMCAVGPLAGSVPGEELTLAGRYVEHPSYGVQFEAVACAFRLPEEEGAVLKYLSSGVLPGVGPATARRIVERFGAQALEVLATSPEQLADIRGLSPEKARQAGRRFLELFGMREAMAGLSGLGLSASEAIALYRLYEDTTLERVHQNPYLLCGHPLFISFARADAIAEQLGFDREGSERIRAAILYTLRHNLNNGHTCLPKQKLAATACSFFSIAHDAFEEALDVLLAGGEVGLVHCASEFEAGGIEDERLAPDGVDFAYLAEYLRAEMNAALRIRSMASGRYDPPELVERRIALREQAENITYAPLQKKAIKSALTHGALVITGGPGTGKTTTVNAILALFEQEAERVALAAPTGRAAKRMSELTGRKASTLHRLLEVEYGGGAADRPVFKRNEQNPLKCDVLVVDEMSMVDALLFENLLAALKPSCRLVMVGDTDQLPSVGAGNVLGGILQSGVVPVVQLDQIFRQAAASLIVSNAHRIVEGVTPKKGGKEDDFFLLRAFGTHAQNLIAELAATRLPTSYDYSPLYDIQVLCPGRKGILGTAALGARLQETLNPAALGKPELRYGGQVFRLGDKVMQVKNNYDIPYTRDDGEPGAGAFNGDIGVVVEVDVRAGALTVQSEDRQVFYTQENLHELELAWAVTIHKSQGSEFEAVIIPVTEVPGRLRYRNLLYTGITRAKRLCILVGEEEVVEQMVRNGKRNGRFSCFAHFLCDDKMI